MSKLIQTLSKLSSDFKVESASPLEKKFALNNLNKRKRLSTNEKIRHHQIYIKKLQKDVDDFTNKPRDPNITPEWKKSLESDNRNALSGIKWHKKELEKHQAKKEAEATTQHRFIIPLSYKRYENNLPDHISNLVSKHKGEQFGGGITFGEGDTGHYEHEIHVPHKHAEAFKQDLIKHKIKYEHHLPKVLSSDFKVESAKPKSYEELMYDAHKTLAMHHKKKQNQAIEKSNVYNDAYSKLAQFHCNKFYKHVEGLSSFKSKMHKT